MRVAMNSSSYLGRIGAGWKDDEEMTLRGLTADLLQEHNSYFQDGLLRLRRRRKPSWGGCDPRGPPGAM